MTACFVNSVLEMLAFGLLCIWFAVNGSIAAHSAQVDREQLQAAVSDIQDFVQSVRRDINFALDEDSGRMIINVTEASSGDVIRQIPSEEALRLAENLTEIRSVLFEAEA